MGAIVLSGCVGSGNAISISLGEAINLSQSNSFSKVAIDTGSGTMSMTVEAQTPIPITDSNGTAATASNGSVLTANIDSLNMADLKSLGFVFPVNTSTNAAASNLTSLLIYLGIPALFILMFIFFARRQAAGGDVAGFGRSGAKLLSPDRPKVTFADVAGVEEAKQDLQEVVEFLKDRAKFQAIGATIPKGVLLVGPPGTGKTLLARALAGEAGVPFFSISGSEFVELFVGVGAARVRSLFSEAKKMAPCIIFIDELDAVGRQRAGNIPGSHEEREQTLNQILVEMDGFDPNIGVIVLAATNRVDVLDQALLRPGRFDRRVTLDRPDTNGRIAILKIHSKGKALAKDVDLELIVKQTHGFSGADLAELMNEAAILAVRRNKKIIGMEELADSIDRVLAGPERKSLAIRPRDKELTAYHEAGHALVARNLPNIDPVLKISIVARGSMGGYTRFLEEDRYFITESQFRSTLATFMAGHAAEQMIFNEVSTGPHGDIKQATDIARKMITEYSMSDKLGFRTYGQTTVQGYLGIGPPETKDYSEDTARQIDDEVRVILENAHDTARKILSENRPRLDHLAGILLTKETLEGPELEKAFTEPITEKPAANPADSTGPTGQSQS
ncbi:ATP-dependent zinc metalloprotease FtsH [Dehalogenimonas formicexedens]|uniref:ATP-dependent zinc metalloprotease FtsH n=1 Tax=Dehalogenimonas formicexedens TaxID=1839801 RepID=UPI001CEF7E42|nr:ATP-dependent zinc metalloprotease FtsH [Dehalogenimonas formicexedens]